MIRTDRNTKLPLMRLLDGIRNFGYTFESAIFDIVDNSIVAKAPSINIFLEYDENIATQNINRIIISDNGIGMDQDDMYNALFLGSPSSNYTKNSLSKYGFGLKSAGLSLGDTVTVIARKNVATEWKKAQIDWGKFEDKNEYVVDEDLTIDENEKQYLVSEKGTIVIISNLLDINRINALKAVKSLKKYASVTFHRFLEESISLFINNEKVEPFDPLFCNELSGKFSDYNGREPKSFWEDDQIIPINSKEKVKAKLKAVVLPCPPLFQREGRRSEVLKKYGISKQNIGFYIYRNKRLIKKGVTLGLLSRQDKTYHIRIRIDLDSSCDNYINLDVKKTELYFNESFMEKLENRINPFINRAIELWDQVQKKGEDETKTVSDLKHDRSNKLLSAVEPVKCDPQTLEIQQVQKELENKIDEIKKAYPNDSNIIEQIKERNRDRVIAVDSLENGLLWKPGISEDGKSNVIVCISRLHPFYTEIYQNLEPGSDAVVILDALFLCMAMSELGISAVDTTKMPKVFKMLRQTVSTQLSNIIDISVDSEEDIDNESD